MKSLLVMGSINLDVSLRVVRLPRLGETLMGHGVAISPGGKGANQAHAASLMGSRVKMVGAVGNDDMAEPALSLLHRAGVDLAGVRRLAGAATGLASIHVIDSGENAIVVSQGANQDVRADWVSDALLAECDTLLLQGEVPVAQSMALARRAKAAGLRVMLNLAPMRDPELIHANELGALIVNQGELQALVDVHGLAIDARADPGGATLRLARLLGCDVVATLGADGACAASPDGGRMSVAALSLPAIDTTGAGDTFCGVLAAAFNQGQDLRTSLAQASVAAGLACTRRGAQSSQPQRHDVLAAMSRLATPRLFSS